MRYFIICICYRFCQFQLLHLARQGALVLYQVNGQPYEGYYVSPSERCAFSAAYS